MNSNYAKHAKHNKHDHGINHRHKVYFAAAIIVVALAAIMISLANGNYFFGMDSRITNYTVHTVHGTSMAGIISDGTQVKVVNDYYETHKPQRNDIVLYNYSGDPEPLVKIVKGMPGDRFELVQDGAWKIKLNRKMLTNSAGTEYILDEKARRILSLYEEDYRNTIPDDAYLLLGNIPSGSIDSTRFGFADKKDIIGKVFP